MPNVTIFIPISRPDHLDRLFISLEHLECDAATTRLLTYVDGNRQLFERAQTLTEASKFGQWRCVRRADTSPVSHGMYDRRKRISAIKNESKALIGECDFVFGIEDDTIMPPHALEQLLAGYITYPYAGFIEGVELGRWGVPYVGAWRTDDVYEPTKIESLMPGQGLEEVDAGGFYCYLTKREHYLMQEYKPFGRNDLGPDVNWGLYLRQQGFKNYIDWRVNCEHRLPGGGSVSASLTTPRAVAMVKEGDSWQQKIA